MSHTYEVYFDGSCRMYRGKKYAGFGYCILKDGFTWALESGRIDDTKYEPTNNVAEYLGLIESAEHIKKDPEFCDNCKISFKGDSSLVINQMRGSWKIKNSKMKKLNERANGVLKNIECKYEYIPRESNEKADYLSKIHTGG